MSTAVQHALTQVSSPLAVVMGYKVRNCYALSVTHFIRRPLRSYAVTHFIFDPVVPASVTSRCLVLSCLSYGIFEFLTSSSFSVKRNFDNRFSIVCRKISVGLGDRRCF